MGQEDVLLHRMIVYKMSDSSGLNVMSNGNVGYSQLAYASQKEKDF